MIDRLPVLICRHLLVSRSNDDKQEIIDTFCKEELSNLLDRSCRVSINIANKIDVFAVELDGVQIEVDHRRLGLVLGNGKYPPVLSVVLDELRDIQFGQDSVGTHLILKADDTTARVTWPSHGAN